MKCCICGKEVDEMKNEIPPKWFGRYRMSELVELICDVCIKKPENKDKWVI